MQYSITSLSWSFSINYYELFVIQSTDGSARFIMNYVKLKNKKTCCFIRTSDIREWKSWKRAVVMVRDFSYASKIRCLYELHTSLIRHISDSARTELVWGLVPKYRFIRTSRFQTNSFVRTFIRALFDLGTKFSYERRMKPIRKFGFGPIRAISELYPTKLGIRPDFTRTKNPSTHSASVDRREKRNIFFFIFFPPDFYWADKGSRGYHIWCYFVFIKIAKP